MVLSTANTKVIVSRMSLQVVTIASYRSCARNLIFGFTVESNFGKKKANKWKKKWYICSTKIKTFRVSGTLHSITIYFQRYKVQTLKKSLVLLPCQISHHPEQVSTSSYSNDIAHYKKLCSNASYTIANQRFLQGRS